ncbi:MAG: lytic murein transglycosylase [Deltaproteobacteria bacterium]|jgi:membrane-bound lytic murein transglycosylase B|nr:lytic murein transglycosylase [Deltaproteobacteria bacterium]
MKYYRLPFLISLALGLALPVFSIAEQNDAAFLAWLKAFQSDAHSQGLSKKTLEQGFSEIKVPLAEVIERDSSQPEMTQSVDDYLASRVSSQRIKSGRRMMRRYPTWLGRVERTYQVQRRYLVALWGVESHYGEHTGTYPVLQSLATLAYDGRRSGYFRKELIEALRLIDDGIVPQHTMRGSWAGAMGQCQFMPSSVRHYAVDEDSSGSINLWRSVPDVLGSIANYLAKAGWRYDQTWGREVVLPQNFDHALVGLETRHPLSRWQALGVRRINGRALPKRDLQASLIMPDGTNGRAYLVYDNFRVLLKWNRSSRFAIAVGALSDQLRGL